MGGSGIRIRDFAALRSEYAFWNPYDPDPEFCGIRIRLFTVLRSWILIRIDWRKLGGFNPRISFWRSKCKSNRHATNPMKRHLNHVFDDADSNGVCFQRSRLLPTFLEIELARAKPVTTSRLTIDSFRQTPNPQGSIDFLIFLQFWFRKTHNFDHLISNLAWEKIGYLKQNINTWWYLQSWQPLGCVSWHWRLTWGFKKLLKLLGLLVKFLEGGILAVFAGCWHPVKSFITKCQLFLLNR